jgi:hypothetical protein
MSALDGIWRSLPLLREGCSALSVSPNGAHLCFDQTLYNDGSRAGRALIFGALDDQLAFVERRRVDVSQHEFGLIALDDDGGAVWFARGTMGGVAADCALREGAVDGWSHVGVHPVPFAKVPRELEHGYGASPVWSRDRRWLAANGLRNVVSVLFATDDSGEAQFREVKALPKLQTVADFSRDGSLVAIRSKKHFELRDVARWKKLLSVELAGPEDVLFSPSSKSVAVLRSTHPQVVIYDASTGAMLAESPESMPLVSMRHAAWVRDDAIVFNNGVIELPRSDVATPER